MAAGLGRSVILTWNGTAVAGVREKKKSVNFTPVDVTTGEDSGWRTLLTEPGQKEINISLSGITKTDALKNDILAGNLQRSVTLTYPNGAVLSGTFQMINFNETGPYNDGITFDCELQSTGTIVWSPGT